MDILVCPTCTLKFIKKKHNQMFRVVQNTINMDGSGVFDYYCSEACYMGLKPGLQARCGHPYAIMGQSSGKTGVKWICLECMKLNDGPVVQREPSPKISQS